MFERLRLNLAARLLGSPEETRDPPGLLVPDFLVGQEVGFPANYRSYAREAMAKNEVVFAVIREIATSFAELPLRVWRNDRGRRVPVDDHPFRKLIARPNPWHESEYELWETSQTYYQLAGETFFFKARNAAGVTTELWPVRPDRIGHIPSGPGAETPVATWFYETEDGERTPIAVEDLIQIKIPDPEDPIRGLSPVRVAARSIDADNKATDFVNTFMGNAGVPSGALRVNAEYDGDLQKRLVQQWRARHAGSSNVGKLMILWQNTEYQQFAVSPRQMEFPDLRRLTETRIAMVWGVSPILIQAFAGLERNTFTNMPEARRSFYDETLLPLCRKFCDPFQSRFVNADPRREPDVRGLRFNAGGLELGFDKRDVRALQEDEIVKWQRITGGFRAGLVPWKFSLGQLGINLDELDPDDVVFISPGVLPAGTDAISDGDPASTPVPPGAIVPATPDDGEARQLRSDGQFVRVRDLLPLTTGQLSSQDAEARATSDEQPSPRKKRRR